MTARRDIAQAIGMVALSAAIAAVALAVPVAGGIWLLRSSESTPVEDILDDAGFKRDPPGSRATRPPRGTCDSGVISMSRDFANDAAPEEVFAFYAMALPQDGWTHVETATDGAAFEKQLGGFDATLVIGRWNEGFVVTVSSGDAPC